MSDPRHPYRIVEPAPWPMQAAFLLAALLILGLLVYGIVGFAGGWIRA